MSAGSPRRTDESRPPAGANVELRQVSKVFDAGSPPAVDRVGLTVAPGEFMTFLGPSGSGKTTTLNMIAGFVRATSGSIMIDDRDVAHLPAHKRGLGMVFQHYALFPHMSVAENVAFPLRRRKVGKKDAFRRAHEVLELVGLTGYGDRRPEQLSGGQQQRVALARAVVFNPPVLLMDEPLGALDKKLRRQLQGEISRMHRELGITFIFVTHDQEEALALSDRIAVFNSGRIEQAGAADELYEQPSSLFVADFLGDSNIFTGTIRGSSGGARLEGDGYSLAVAPGAGPAAGPAAVMVRPERIRLLTPGTTAVAGTNALSATVTEVVYQGSHRKLRFRCDCGVTGQCLEPVGVASAPAEARVGDQVTVTWQAHEAVMVPVEGHQASSDDQHRQASSGAPVSA